MPKSQLSYVISQFDGEIRCTDELLSRLWKQLKELGLWDSTAIIVTADHGEDFFEHGKKGHKNDIYSQSVHVPLVIKPPGPPRPKRDERLTSLVDLFPTVLDFAGIEHSANIQGRSLLQPASDVPLPIFFELDAFMYMQHPVTGAEWTDASKWRGMQLDRHKLVAIPEKNVWELYDVVDDPGEHRPLGDTYRGKKAQLRILLQEQEKAMQAIAARKGKPAEVELSEEELKRLESLGYIDRRKSDEDPDGR